jgi:alpha-mannosidase
VTIETDVELRRPEEATRALDIAEPAWAASLTKRIVSSRSSSPRRRGYLVINPLGLPRRAAVLLPDAAADLRPEGPLRAAQLTDEGVYAVVDLPPFGFAWVPAETALDRPATATKALSARERDLRNESIAIEVDNATGGLRSIAKVDEPSPRLGQQLVIHGLTDTAGKPIASQMRRDTYAVDFGGPALVQATSTGWIVHPSSGSILANYEQRYRLWTGRPILEVRINLSALDPAWLEQAGRSDPWSSYLACRWAWPDASSMLRRTVLWSPEMTELDRPETPDALDITTRTQRTAILCGGLPYHRKASPRMLDTLLVTGAERCREFSMGVAIDLEYPFHAAQDVVTTTAVVPTEDGPPSLGVAGWLARIDRQNVAISRVEFTENAADRGWGLVFHLVETSGQSGRCRLRLFRNPTWARQVDFLGETIVDLSVEDDAVTVDLTPHELARIEVTLG